MRNYPSADNAFNNLLFELLHSAPVVPSRDGPTHEIVGAQVVIDPKRPFVTNQARKFSPVYGAGEFMWYLAGSGSIEHIAHYAPSYKRFARADGTAFGAYGARWAETQQLMKLLNVLYSTPDSRQAILVQWMPRDLDAASGAAAPEKDLPCTLTLQFLRRGAVLHLIVSMRSNDAWLGMPNDWFCFMMLQHLVAGFLGCETGLYIHQAGSLHLYERDWEKARQACQEWGQAYRAVEFSDESCSPKDAQAFVETACNVEHVIRTCKKTAFSYYPVPPLLRMMLHLCVAQNASTHGYSPDIPEVLRDLIDQRRKP